MFRLLSLNVRQLNKQHISSKWLILLSALYFTTVLNLSLWRYIIEHLEIDSIKTFFFGCTLPVFIFCVMTCFFNVILVPYAAKPLLILFTIVSSATNYLMFNLGIMVDADMVRNVLETNVREACDLITLNSIIWVTLGGILPAVFIGILKIDYKKPGLSEIKLRLIISAYSFCAVGLITTGFYKEYATFGRNNKHLLKIINTTNYIAAIAKHYQRAMLGNQQFQIIDDQAKLVPYADAGHTVFVLIIGETARADHFSLNGYGQNTNPELPKENVISFKNVFSCGTATNISLPCMFSDVTRQGQSKNGDLRNRENLVDLAQRAGYEVIWLENDDGCKGVCKRVPTENLFRSKNTKYCDGESCYDEILIDGLEDRIRNLKKDALIVMHMIGSHGPTYYKRYPDSFKRFSPTCDTADLQKCTEEEISNTYDNTIVYTDYVVANAIRTLKKFPELESGLMYISDHGESLGENGIYLHGLPYSIAPEEQKHVPMVLWMSERMKKQDHLDFSCIAKKADSESVSHDNLFSTLLALMEIKSRTYDKSLDMFDSCRKEPLPTLPMEVASK